MIGVGFTGTQQGTAYEQARGLYALLAALREPYDNVFQHGDCVGADAEAHALARHLGYAITIHPPLNTSKQAHCRGATLSHPPEEYIARNHRIVNDSRMLVATPAGYEEELRSGTWATVRYARRRQRPIVMVWPDGTYGLQLPRMGGSQTHTLLALTRRLGLA